jgi:hypothetical protein
MFACAKTRQQVAFQFLNRNWTADPLKAMALGVVDLEILCQPAVVLAQLYM